MNDVVNISVEYKKRKSNWGSTRSKQRTKDFGVSLNQKRTENNGV